MREEARAGDWASTLTISQNDYQFTGIPYGVNMNAESIASIMLDRDENYQSGRRHGLHRHLCFVGGIMEVFEDCCLECPEVSTNQDRILQSELDRCCVRGPLTLSVGLVRRMSDGMSESSPFRAMLRNRADWFDTAYLSYPYNFNSS
jgi:hypothetical protein